MNDETRWNDAVDRILDGTADRPPGSAEEHEAVDAVGALTRALAKAERPPESLRQRLRADVRAFGNQTSEGTRVVPFPAEPNRESERGLRRWFPARAWGWQAAAAAALVLALAGWLRPEPSETPESVPKVGTAQVAEDRLQFERDTRDWARARFAAGQDRYSGLDAEVVWSGERQDGFLRLRGLPANDPTLSQYQLWIVDPGRDELPVDGGVFDIPVGSDEALVRFRPRLPIRAATAFVITREIPGGVVRSRNPAPVAIARL
ncbi:MAG: anti-sigma factor [Verrucomicrobiales bacterium]|nr:anti-sigma factor [Verrucomicrobiales bacterium]